MEIIAIAAVICAVLGYIIASDNNKPMGAILGLFLGPLGVLISVFLKG